MAVRHTVAKVGEIEEGYGKAAFVEGREVGVFLYEGQYYAVENGCPHMGAPLSRGWVEDGVVTCPLHYWRFRLKDGVWADDFNQQIACFTVHVEGDEIRIEVPE